MDVEYGMAVVDKNDAAIGTIGKIIMDAWTDKPRKYLVTRVIPQSSDEIFLIPPEQVGEVTAGKVKLLIAVEDLREKPG